MEKHYYRIGYNKYPLLLHLLTTPIEYYFMAHKLRTTWLQENENLASLSRITFS